MCDRNGIIMRLPALPLAYCCGETIAHMYLSQNDPHLYYAASGRAVGRADDGRVTWRPRRKNGSTKTKGKRRWGGLWTGQAGAGG